MSSALTVREDRRTVPSLRRRNPLKRRVRRQAPPVVEDESDSDGIESESDGIESEEDEGIESESEDESSTQPPSSSSARSDTPTITQALVRFLSH